jgi:hypothetical protein
MNEFNPGKDNIAVVVKEFTLKKKSEIFFDRYSEPFIISLAIDEHGASNPSIDFNLVPFPNVRAGETIAFDGQGHLIYGPSNPGSFLAYSIMFMESDNDLRKFAEKVEDIMRSEALSLGAKALLAATPTYSTAITVLMKLTELIANRLKKNKDDELFRRNGTLLRDSRPPYDILRTYKSQNEFIRTNTSIIPLISSNQLGKQVEKIAL